MKIEGVMGCILLIVSGCMYAFERFLSVFRWACEAVPVKMSVGGSYPSNPTIPGVFDNIFVPILFIIGLLLIIISFRTKIEDRI